MPPSAEELVLRRYKREQITTQFRRGHLILCEGDADCNFLSHLLVDRKIFDFDLIIPDVEGGGVTAFDRCLKALTGATSFDDVIRGVVLVADSNDDPGKRLDSLKKVFANNGLPSPEKPFKKIATEKIKTAIVMIPSATNPGNLESLLLEAAFDKHPEMNGCIEEFVKCSSLPLKWKPNQQAKMKIHSLVAARCEGDPSSSVAYLWGKKENPVPIESKRFDFIADFLGSFTS